MEEIASAEAFAVANSLFLEEEYEKALEKYSTAIELDPTVANYFASRALTYIQLEKYTDAITDADAAVELDPNFADAYLWKGRACFVLDMSETAKALFKKAFSLEPSADAKKWIHTW
eukprot:CAMPEP_0184645256 /NCGR_PEP_ID=MMETSP0308-20130426/1752_1 /TAXON_ID=38269 /ORGANISM="Gloeochaete witrockiana, Strain SAG 46.84" /LENGTH=116 /DNA_ID=CAMNT_0027074133 /DNA_START=116 /DNA_END=463 /DNA_ORIENTATION=+